MSDSRQKRDAMTNRPILDELRDALDDAIRRAYCEPLVPPMEGEDPDAVREITTARILANPHAMRQLVALQRAAWNVVEQWIEIDPEVERLRVFEAAFAKVPQEQQARIMAAVRAEMAETPSSDAESLRAEQST